MHRFIKLVLITSVVLVASPVLARGKEPKPSKEDVSARESKERDARKACLSGDYATGVAALTDLFLDTKDPTWIFNQGRCYEQNERYEEAIGRFREYSRTGNVPQSPSDVAAAEKHIADCEALIQKRNAAMAAPVAVPPGPAVVPVPVAQPQPVVAYQQNQPVESSSNGSGKRTAGVVLMSVGGAALVAGVVLNLKANSLASSITPPNTYQRSTESQRETYQTMSYIGYGVGAAALVAGTVVYLLGRSDAHDSGATVALVPTIGPGTAGAMFWRTF